MGLVMNIVTHNVKKSSLVVQSPHWFLFPPPPPSKRVSIAWNWFLSNEWLKCLFPFTTQKTSRLPRRVPVPYQPVTMDSWVNEGDTRIINVKGGLGGCGWLGGLLIIWWCCYRYCLSFMLVVLMLEINPCPTWLERGLPGMDHRIGTGSSVFHSRCGRWRWLVVVRAWTKSGLPWLWKKLTTLWWR